LAFTVVSDRRRSSLVILSELLCSPMSRVFHIFPLLRSRFAALLFWC
jgi:hypothetical protein